MPFNIEIKKSSNLNAIDLNILTFIPTQYNYIDDIKRSFYFDNYIKQKFPGTKNINIRYNNKNPNTHKLPSYERKRKYASVDLVLNDTKTKQAKVDEAFGFLSTEPMVQTKPTIKKIQPTEPLIQFEPTEPAVQNPFLPFESTEPTVQTKPAVQNPSLSFESTEPTEPTVQTEPILKRNEPRFLTPESQSETYIYQPDVNLLDNTTSESII